MYCYYVSLIIDSVITTHLSQITCDCQPTHGDGLPSLHEPRFLGVIRAVRELSGMSRVRAISGECVHDVRALPASPESIKHT